MLQLIWPQKTKAEDGTRSWVFQPYMIRWRPHQRTRTLKGKVQRFRKLPDNNIDHICYTNKWLYRLLPRSSVEVTGVRGQCSWLRFLSRRKLEASRRALMSERRARERLESACSRCCPEMWVRLDSSCSETLLESRQMSRSWPRGRTDPQPELDNRSDAGERGWRRTNEEIKPYV